MTDSENTPRVALLVTCLVDLFRPNIGFSAVQLLEAAGCSVIVPRTQTCCGQPGYNNGDQRGTRQLAKQVIKNFEPYDYVVVPSGSCAAMLREHYPKLFDDQWRSRALALAEKTYELTAFLVDVCNWENVEAEFEGRIAYHDSCSGLRELSIRQQPRQLLANVKGVELCELQDSEACCGFGGTFCVKYPDISVRMVSDKVANIQDSGADTVVASDLGCLLNIAGRLHRLDKPVRAYHVAEILANMSDAAAIGESQAKS